jgi:hypothetical protein
MTDITPQEASNLGSSVPLFDPAEHAKNLRAFAEVKSTLKHGSWALVVDGALKHVADNKEDLFPLITKQCYLVQLGHENDVGQLSETASDDPILHVAEAMTDGMIEDLLDKCPKTGEETTIVRVPCSHKRHDWQDMAADLQDTKIRVDKSGEPMT